MKFGLEAQAAMVRGVNLLADTVAVTLGPGGRLVLVEAAKGSGPPRITKDGVAVADALQVGGPMEQMGLRLVRRAGQRVGEEIGDGTTTTILLARALVLEGLAAVAAGYDVMALRHALQDGVAAVVEGLRRMARPIEGWADYIQVATISANGDTALGEIIAEAFNAVDKDGVVSVESGKILDTTWEKLNGLQWDGGYVSPYFMTNASTTECQYDNPMILLTEHTIEDHTSLLRPLEAAVRAGRPLLIVAEGVKGEALRTLTLNKIKNNLRVVAGKGPKFGDRRRDTLEDVALLTGGKLVSDRRGDSLKVIDPETLGSAKRIILTQHKTTIIGGMGRTSAIEKRANSIRAMQSLENNTPFQEKTLRERLAKLTGGVAIIRVGGASEAEMKERKDRADDAVNALRAAANEGVLPGGGSAYIHASRVLDDGGTEISRVAARILRRALAVPAIRIADNAGYNGREVAATISLEGGSRKGFDASVGVIRDLFAAGVIDPARVSISALEAANSVASLLLTAETVIARPTRSPRPTKSDEIPFGPEAKDMTAEEASSYGLVS